MEAKERSFSFISKPLFYDIPFFQRNYVWSYWNWEELLAGLSDPKRCSFLGSLILKQVKTPSDSIGCFSIIDGQQRLTTLSILLRACYDTLMLHPENYPEDVIHNFKSAVNAQLFVITNTFTGEKKVKIRHSHIDRPFFESVINGEYTPDSKLDTIILKDEAAANPKTKKETANHILLCYKYFRVQLGAMSIDSIQSLWKILTEDNVKFLVNIDLDADENEQAIFDAVNSSGVRLTSSDTIKNALFQKYIDLLKRENTSVASEEAAVKLYNQTWVKAFLDCEEDALYWATQHQSGRLFRDNIEILLHCVAVIEGFFDPQIMKMSEIAQCYKDHIAGMEPCELSAFINRIKDYAELYKERIVTNESTVLYAYADFFTRLIHILDTLEISTFHPYVLSLLYKNKILPDEDALKTACEKLERYVVLHAICKATTKNYNKECLLLINGETVDNLLETCDDITVNRFYAGLAEMDSNRIATLLLFWIELYKRHNEKPDQKELKYTFTLEHIMPQKWKEYWSVNDLPVTDAEGNHIENTEEAETTRARAVYEIGNMTLLNSKLNTSLRNYSFRRKISGEGKKKGVKDLADCMITREILDTAVWNEQAIAQRTKTFSDIIKIIWKITF